ncbi:hypothetical protein BGX34_001907 [Mortierella sp. NVP85]|nr:hypothetical protein BGX34_001907 [Mortierella sp. NVP85]
MPGVDRVSRAISEVRGMFVQELGKIFPQLKDQDGLSILGMSSEDHGDISTEKNYIPNAEQIQFTIAYYSQLVGAQDSVSTTELPSLSEESAPTLPEPSESHTEHDQKDAALPPDKTDDDAPMSGSTAQGGRGTIKKMSSTPDLRAAIRPTLETRRKSDDRASLEVSKATRGAAFELAQEEELLRKSHPDNVLKEFMRTQGALRSLMAILSDKSSGQQRVALSAPSQKHPLSSGTRLATKIDIMETVCRVLFQNSENQQEFKAMDGYSTLLNVFDEIVVPANGAKPAEHDTSSGAQESTNMEHGSGETQHHHLGLSKELEFTTGLEYKRPVAELDIRQHALYTIQDLVFLNPLNTVAAWRCGEVDMVIGKLREYLCFRPTCGTLRDAQWELGRQMQLDVASPNTRHVVFSELTYFDKFIVSEDTAALAELIEDGSPIYQYVIALTRLLEYMAVMLIQDNDYILYELSRLLMEVDFPDDSSIIVNIVLRCVGRIISDKIARGITVEEKFASIYLQIVRSMQECRNRIHKSEAAIEDEQEQELRDCVHTEQRLLSLQILGLVLKGMNHCMEVFELLQGFEMLTSTILLEKRSCRHVGRASEKFATYADSLMEPSLCQDCYRSDIVVSDLALWLFRDLALQDPDNKSIMSWLVTMLKTTLSGIEELRRQSEVTRSSSRYGQGFLHVQPDQPQDQAHALLVYLYTKICATVSIIFRASSDSKLAFGEACGMQLLLSVLSSAQHPDIATAALVAIGDFFAGYEGTKALLGDTFGYDGFLEIVLASCRPLDKGTPSRPSSIYLDESLEINPGAPGGTHTPIPTGSLSASSSVLGNTGVLSGTNHRYSIFGISPWSSSATPSIAVSSVHENVDMSPILSVAEPHESASTGSSRSSVHLQRSGHSTPAPVNIAESRQSGDEAAATGNTVPSGSNRSLHVPRSKGVVNRKRSNSRNLGGFGLNTTNLGLRSVVPSERLAFKQLAGIVFRDADAARMTLRLLGRIIECNNPQLATDYFNLLMLLMEVTPRNKELLSRNEGLRYMLVILFNRGRQHDGLGMNTPGYPFLPRAADPPYVDLVPAMGAYDISVEDVRLLFDAVYDPLEMFIRLTTEPKQTMPSILSSLKDSLGPLPELPAKFDKEPGSRRNSAGRPRSESASAATPYSGRKTALRYHGATPSAYSGLPFNPLFIAEMEQQMMYAIEKISERIDPPAYFNFNGLDASLTTYPGVVEKAVSAKGGYTVSIWVKVTAFLEKETGLFCYEEENGNRTIFELYFKSLDQSNRYCLCVRTQHYPSPPEDFVFDRFDFAETGIWHHIVFVHHKTMKLMVDGCVIQSYGTFNQRRQEKDGAMTGVLGRKGRNFISNGRLSDVTSGISHPSPPSSQQDVHHQFSASTLSVSSSVQSPQQSQTSNQEQSLGYFCGQTGKVHFLQGEWDQATAEKVYNLGPASMEPWKTIDIKSPVIAVLDPEDFLRDMESASEVDNNHAVTKEPSSTKTNEKVLAHGVLRGGCTIHMTRAMRDLIGKVGGIQLCFRFLGLKPSHLQLVGLRVISNLLYKSPENIAQFQNELDGYEIMYELLLKTASELSIDHFGVLFDIAINGMIKDEHLILSSMPCVHLILRLLPSTMDSVQSYILRTLVDLIVESPENMRLWRASFGMTTLFSLFKSLPAQLRPFLMWTLESMMDGMTVQELGLLIGFIGHEEPELFEVRRDIIEMLFKRMTTDHSLVDLLGSGLEGVTVLIGLLDSPNEHFRVLILKMIGILLSDNTKSGKAALDKPNIGIGLIRSTLEKYPLSMDVIQVLLGLAQNSYRCDPNHRSIDKSAAIPSRKSGEKSTLQQQRQQLPSPIAISPLSPHPLKDLQQLASTPEQLSSHSGSIPDLGMLQNSFEEQPIPTSAKSETKDSSSQRTPASRKHSNAASAPFIKMSALPMEPLIISNVTNSNPVNEAGASQASQGGAKITDELTYASMIRLILELTGSLPHTDLVTHTLTDLKRLMTSENMRILWEAGWVNWIGAFMNDKIKVRVSSAAENLSYNRAMVVLDGMMQKMMIFDLSRKGSFTVRNKGTLVSRDEDITVQLRLTEAALAWLDKKPNLDTEAASMICKGIVFLFRRLEELSRRFEEQQRQAEKIRQKELERKRALEAQMRAEEQERERLALEALSSALHGVFDHLEDSESDELETKSFLLKAEEGDTDAEEVSIHHVDDESLASDSGEVSIREGPTVPRSGSSSPASTSSTASVLSLPHPTFSEAPMHGNVYSVDARDSFESQSGSKSPSTTQQHPSSVRHQRHRSPQSRHSRSAQSRFSTISSPTMVSSTTPVLPESISTSMAHRQDKDFDGSGLMWPPLRLYEHFVMCINNLACHNNSVIRTAMKSSGLFKIRDSLVEKLGQPTPNATSGGHHPLTTMEPHQHQFQNLSQHPSPSSVSPGFNHHPFVYSESSSAPLALNEVDMGFHGAAYDNNVQSPGSANPYSISRTAQDIPPNANSTISTTTGRPGSMGNRPRNRSSQQRTSPMGLGLGLPSVI